VANNEKEISHGRVLWQTYSVYFPMGPLDAMKGCKAWAKRAHALYEKQNNNNPS
jgi:hypothetical protein